MVDLSHSSRLLLSLLICSVSIGLCDTAAINRTCGTKTPSDAVLKQDRLVRQNLRKQLKKKHPLDEGEYSQTRQDFIPLDEEPQILIPVKFICFTNSTGWGEFSKAQAMQQITILNKGFNGTAGNESQRPQAVDTRISFKFESLEVVEDDLYFYQAGNEARMKREYALHTDRYMYIFTADLGESLLGWADFPNTNPEGHYLWSVVLHFGTIPGFSFFWEQYNKGGTLVHEMGHMLGLYHTFQDGCSSINDEVSDTPACESSLGCPSVLDTCPSYTGADQTENFMSYSDDACMNTFTMGQALRIRESLKAYRPSSLHFWSRDAAGDAFTYSPTTVPPPTPPVMQLSQIIAAAPTLECNSIVEVEDIRVSGYDLLGSFSPEMLYKFTLEQPQLVQIRSCGSSYDTVLMLYQPDDVPLPHSRDDDHDLCGAESLQSVIEVVLDPGDYYAVVEAYSLTSLSTSGYTKLELQCSVPPPTPPVMNLSQIIAAAPTLECNSIVEVEDIRVSGYDLLGSPSPEMLYKFTLEQRQVVQIRSCGSSYDTVLMLYQPDDVPLPHSSNDDSDLCGAGSLRSVIEVVLAPGDYYAVVEAYLLTSLSTSGYTKLELRCEPSPTTTAPTPNPTPSPTTTKPPPPRICRVDEYTKRTFSRDKEPSRFLSAVTGSLTVAECAKACAEETRCSSFNYRRGIAKCVLMSAPDRTQSYATAANRKWDNYQMTDTCYDDCPATVLDRFLNLGGVPMRDKSGISGNLLKTINNVSKNKCAKKCENNADCYAFNHRTAVDRVLFPYKCELLKAPDLYDFSYHEPADITVGWRYFRMKSSCASVKKAQSHLSGCLLGNNC